MSPVDARVATYMSRNSPNHTMPSTPIAIAVAAARRSLRPVNPSAAITSSAGNGATSVIGGKMKLITVRIEHNSTVSTRMTSTAARTPRGVCAAADSPSRRP